VKNILQSVADTGADYTKIEEQQKAMNKYGAEGWELVAIKENRGDNMLKAYFKRG
jgi:hypothetical protein